MNNPFLIGDKVYLRALERSDAPVVLPWFNDSDILRFTRRYRPMNAQAEERYIEQVTQSEENVVLLVVRREDDRPIGVTSFHQMNVKNRNAVWGIIVGDKTSWGRGYGTEATALMMRYGFETLNLHRVTLHVFADNPRAIHVYEKLGFKKEGVMREENYCDGRYGDTIVMGLLREEWSLVTSH